jgi:type II secretory pathway pseudopilin PulG
MVEIALCLAIIGFALVAIIGVLPTGLSVQKDNREETIINFEANFLMDAIRSGSRGQDDLTNYIISITNRYYTYVITPSATNLVGPANDYNYFTTSEYSLKGTLHPTPFLTNGSNIIGLLSIPKYLPGADASHFISNYVSADFRGLSGSVMDQGTNDASRDFAFRYRLEPEIVQNGWKIAYDPSWLNPNVSGLSPAELAARADYAAVATNLQANLNQVRLRFKWPVLPNGKTGNGRQVFRTSAGGQITNVFLGSPSLTLYFIESQTYGQPHLQAGQ